MIKKKFPFCLLMLLFCSQILKAQENLDFKKIVAEKNLKSLIISTTEIAFKDFPGAFNPSIAKTDLGFLLTFRYIPEPSMPWVSYIGIVKLNENTLQPISSPQILHTRIGKQIIPSQSEDARVFSYNGHTYVIYNDNVECINPTCEDRRDVFIAQVNYVKGRYSLSTPVKLYHLDKYPISKWQKNWVPFEWDKTLLINYSIRPHEVLYPNLNSGKCQTIYQTLSSISWSFGEPRGGTPALLIDDEYLAFFHSSIYLHSSVSKDIPRYHYFIGAYTFSAQPPYNITKVSSCPIIGKDFYMDSNAEKRVVFPGGFIVKDSYIYLAYGKDDREIWIAKLNKEALKSLLIPISLEKNN